MHILAADDDSSMTAFYKALFEDAGYTVTTADDATRAMEEFYNRKPDLLVLDADMPGGGGEHIFTIARKLLAGGVPVIFVTGMPDRVSGFALTQAKVRVFAKPVESQQLLDAVAELINAK